MHEASFETGLLLSGKEMESEYRRLNENNVHTPYLYTHTKDNQRLTYLGVNHINNPNDDLFNEIKANWEIFLDKVDKEQLVVLVEGGIRPIERAKNTKELIERFGEPGFMQDLAQKNSIRFLSPEPNRVSEIEYLLSKFSRDDVFYYYFARLVHSWQRKITEDSLEDYWDLYRSQNMKEAEFDTFDFSFGHMKDIHNRKYDHNFSPDDECFEHDANPGKNVVAEACSNFRDIHIVDEILKNWREGKSIFIVYGSGHLVKQQRALEKLLN